MRKSTLVLATAAVLPFSLAACTEKTTASDGDIVVTATDDSCDVSATTGTTGSSTFQVTNNGSKVTEFYVFAEGDRAMGEVENIGPGLTRQLIVSLPEAATYQLACKPGMVGTGIRQDFVVTGDSQAATDESGQLTEAADGYRRYIRSQIVALQDTAAQFVSAVQSGNVDQAKALFPIARTYYERIEPEAESFGELDP
ncbi:MAG: cupredoxin domain-containing protein, partial [Rhodococcus sp. (in: high G+C Gram-positive bacteria)]